MMLVVTLVTDRRRPAGLSQQQQPSGDIGDTGDSADSHQ